MTRFLSLIILLQFSLIFNAFSQVSPVSAPKREFRGVWVATVNNIDWPSKPGLTTDQQQQELIGILEQHKANGLNAIMLQVRPAADAFYTKSREPWSKWLTGTQGLAPAPGYDPLEFAIKEAHLRGMELHAWFNPYRATMGSGFIDETHMTVKHPEWFFTYGGIKQFDPGIPEVQEYLVQVILDVVKEYDVDGIHFDDYFYPYRIAGQTIKDDATFQKYGKGFTNVADWRRSNVNNLIKQMDDSIHYYKKYVKFGVSPFGIWRNLSEDPAGSKTNGLSNYGELYADSRKWIKEGWVDYINPQIYFSFARAVAPFAVLADWWSNNTYGRHLYIGQAAYLMHNGTTKREAAWARPNEIPNQIRYIRGNSRIQGSIFFSSKSFSTVASKLGDSLRLNLYKYPALPPQMPWLDEIVPNPPQNFNAVASADGVQLTWLKPAKAKDGETASGYVIYRFEEGTPVSILHPDNIIKISFLDYSSYLDTSVQKGRRYTYLITALDRLKNESDPGNAESVRMK